MYKIQFQNFVMGYVIFATKINYEQLKIISETRGQRQIRNHKFKVNKINRFGED